MNLTLSTQSFPIAGTFTISRGSKTAADVVLVEVEDAGIKGWGEAVPYARYNETMPQCLAALEDSRAKIEAGIARGDVYWGWGESAAHIAGHMKAPGNMVALLPKGLAARLCP